MPWCSIKPFSPPRRLHRSAPRSESCPRHWAWTTCSQPFHARLRRRASRCDSPTATPGPSRRCSPATIAPQESVWPEEALTRTTRIDFAGREWELQTRALPQYTESLRSWAAWATIAVGVLASGMLGALLLITTGNRRRIEALVERRTAELEAASARLHENQTALVDAQRIARLGSWETITGREGLNASVELHLLLACTSDRLSSLDDLVDAIAPASRSALLDAIEHAAAGSGRIMLDCNTEGLPRRTLQFRIEGEHVDGRLQRIRGTAQDVTALREAEARIRYLARFDPLTGLLNRSAWQDHAQDVLRHAVRHEDRCAILFLDLDDFKRVNDSLGHAAGDRLLTQVAGRLSGCVREEDLVARIGGDEFVILLPRIAHAEEPARVAERVLEALARPLQIDGQPLHVGGSIGIALYPADGGEIDSLLKHADTAMYEAKEAGRNAYRFFLPEMTQRVTRRLQIEAELRRGDRERRAAPALPAPDRCSERPGMRLRGAGALAAPRAGPDPARPASSLSPNRAA
jgi:diguanylate cyclase (GGDEF)-like protein